MLLAALTIAASIACGAGENAKAEKEAWENLRRAMIEKYKCWDDSGFAKWDSKSRELSKQVKAEKAAGRTPSERLAADQKEAGQKYIEIREKCAKAQEALDGKVRKVLNVYFVACLKCATEQQCKDNWEALRSGPKGRKTEPDARPVLYWPDAKPTLYCR